MLTDKHFLEFEILLNLRDSLQHPTFTHDQAKAVLEDIYYDVVHPNRKSFVDHEWDDPNHEITNIFSDIADSFGQFSPSSQNKTPPQRLSDVKHKFKSIASQRGLIGKDRPLLAFDPNFSTSQYHFGVPGIPYNLPDDMYKFAIQYKDTELFSDIYYDPSHYGAVHFVVPSQDDETRYRLTLLLRDLELTNMDEPDSPNQLMDITTLERGEKTHIVASPMTNELAFITAYHSYDSNGDCLNGNLPVREDRDQRVYWSLLKTFKPKLFSPSYSQPGRVIIRSQPAGHLDQLWDSDIDGKYLLKPYGNGGRKHPWRQRYLRVENDETNAPFEFLADQLEVKSIDAFYEGQRHAWINEELVSIGNKGEYMPGPYRPK